mmetsp:Transcript_17449/g.66000  ORF Transcript_17449/g.66000 Transcript_17449/m.66000 type:complete len:173 (+) Transcript_17449:343-861(+)
MSQGSPRCPACKTVLAKDSIVPLYVHSHGGSGGSASGGGSGDGAGEAAADKAADASDGRSPLRRAAHAPPRSASASAVTPPRPPPPSIRTVSSGSGGDDSIRRSGSSRAATASHAPPGDAASFGIFPALFGLHVRLTSQQFRGPGSRADHEEQALRIMTGIIVFFVAYLVFL